MATWKHPITGDIIVIPENNCGNCRHFSKLPGCEGTICTRYPPKLGVGDNGNFQTTFPGVVDVWWCGEWAK